MPSELELVPIVPIVPIVAIVAIVAVAIVAIVARPNPPLKACTISCTRPVENPQNVSKQLLIDKQTMLKMEKPLFISLHITEGCNIGGTHVFSRLDALPNLRHILDPVRPLAQLAGRSQS